MHKKTGSIYASKNCKVQTIYFDFGTLTGSISSKERKNFFSAKEIRAANEEQRQGLGSIMPDVG
jgi:flagellar basal body P-ring protein FlgI